MRNGKRHVKDQRLVIIDMNIESDNMQGRDVMRLAASICGVKLFALSLIVSTMFRNACCVGS